MTLQISSLFALFNSRLSRQIAAWVFTSLVAIEIVLGVPSDDRRKKE